MIKKTYLLLCLLQACFTLNLFGSLNGGVVNISSSGSNANGVAVINNHKFTEEGGRVYYQDLRPRYSESDDNYRESRQALADSVDNTISDSRQSGRDGYRAGSQLRNAEGGYNNASRKFVFTREDAIATGRRAKRTVRRAKRNRRRSRKRAVSADIDAGLEHERASRIRSNTGSLRRDVYQSRRAIRRTRHKLKRVSCELDHKRRNSRRRLKKRNRRVKRKMKKIRRRNKRRQHHHGHYGHGGRYGDSYPTPRHGPAACGCSGHY